MGTIMPFEKRRSRYKETAENKAEAYRVYVEHLFSACDAVDARIFSKGEETGVNYYGARYLDPKYSRWLSGDPALGDYIPKAPIDDEAKKHNENLPGMGGVYNIVNMHLYHYAGNNPIKYEDPDGKDIFVTGTLREKQNILNYINQHSKYKYNLDENGYLIRDGNKTNGFLGFKKSATYTALLDKGINSEKRIGISIGNKTMARLTNGKLGFDYDVEKAGGGATAKIHTDLILVTLTNKNSTYPIKMDNGESVFYTPDEILIHELVGHAIPQTLGKTQGSAIANENIIRKELGKVGRKETNDDPISH